ncbi:hypothetical protein [Acidihalobacter prosperus]|uniref:Uncharacterized protein n=1 Tax=Acidihalobacter prosperus TaxID=160660 RepID=A0A1A6C8S5_9GAMM|nr:hypothetical protein [Acidihalobacter prosperus]OBS10950.1 hypothetical protein Thpro_020666 [Acidihalobacter prosperus]
MLLPFALYAAQAGAALPVASTLAAPPAMTAPTLNPRIEALNRMQVYAAQAMADAIEARAALHDKNLVGLDADLTKVQVMLELIRARMPGAEFLAMVRAMRAKMHFEDNKQVQPFFSHLFYALDDLGDGKVVKHARKYLTRAQHALAVPNRAAALDALRKSAAAFDNPFISPPLKAASANLEQAFVALNASDNTISDNLLKRLVKHLESLHRAFATYPLDMQPEAPATQD